MAASAKNGDSDRQGAAPRTRAVVVIPSYNEKDNIADIIEAALAGQAEAPGYELHVLVSDSHSSDGTLDIVGTLERANPHVHLLDVQQRGIGVGLYRGISHAIEALGAEVLIEMDADFQHNPADIPRFLAKMGEGYDLVVGSRFIAGSENKMPWYRRILSVGANQVIRVMLGLRDITEITTSYRAFTREIFVALDPDAVPWHERSFIAVPIFLVRMIEHGARTVEIPITMHPRTRGYSKMSYATYIRDIMLFSIRSRLGIGRDER